MTIKVENVEGCFDIEKIRPKAGDVYIFGAEEVMFLSPLPVSIGCQSLDLEEDMVTMNDTYLDVGRAPCVEASDTQWVIGAIVYALIMVVGLAPIVAALMVTHGRYGRTFLAEYLTIMNAGIFLWGFFVVLGLGFGVYKVLRITFAKTSSPPLRFNRQRREICYFPDGGDKPSFQKWEDTVAWISGQTVDTAFGSLEVYIFGIAIHDMDAKKVHTRTLLPASLSQSMNKWEAIWVYMEKGPEFFPDVELCEGPHTFEQHRNQLWLTYKKGGVSMLYVLRWYFYRFCTGWSVPYLIAELSHRYSMKAMPECVADWSKPLPPEQWAKPSEELLKQSAEIEKAFDEGICFTDYFDAKKRSVNQDHL